MNALANLFPGLSLSGDVQAPVAIAIAAIVFFYFVHLLRKEENTPHAKVDSPATDAHVEKRQ